VEGPSEGRAKDVPDELQRFVTSRIAERCPIQQTVFDLAAFDEVVVGAGCGKAVVFV
jgi:hypothetical protein